MYRVPSRTTLSRRSFVAGTTALLISTGISPALARTPEDFVADLWPAAKSRGVSSAAFKSALKDFAPLSKVMELSRKQPEFTSTVADYIGKRVNDKRIVDPALTLSRADLTAHGVVKLSFGRKKHVLVRPE